MPGDHLATRHGALALPAFLPDATQAVVRAVDSTDLLNAGVQGLVMNTFHLMQHPGSSTVQALGGLHRMASWPGPILTDSGGFQAYSLIRQNSRYGSLSDRGILFRPEGSNRKLQLTPEKCVQLQLSYGSDIIMCLDDCTHVDAPAKEQQLSVQRTITWAKRCRREFDRLIELSKSEHEEAPLIFGVIQGGGSQELRLECASALLEIGFDGFGYGGWPLDADGNLLQDMLAFTRNLIPGHLPMHALGVGHPYSIAWCAYNGYSLFDSALPTRDARHGRLYAATGDLRQVVVTGKDWLSYLYINDDHFIKDPRPLWEHCHCHTCRHYSRGYLHHLFKSNEASFQRLATIHNVAFIIQLMETLRTANERS